MSKQFAKIKNLTKDVPGWLTYNEGRLLFALAANAYGGPIVEIGSWKGRSTIWLAKGAERGAGLKVCAVDPHTGSREHHDKYGKVDTFQIFQSNIARAGVSGSVMPYVCTSEEAAKRIPGPVSMVFIDGDHSYEAVKRDCEIWIPRLRNGGFIALHDTTGWYGPTRAAEDLFRSKHMRRVEYRDSITFGEKVVRATFWERAKNHYVLALKRVHLALRKPLKRAKRLRRALKPFLYKVQ